MKSLDKPTASSTKKEAKPVPAGEAKNCPISRESALELLKKYNKEHFHIRHALTVEGVMRWFAMRECEDEIAKAME